MSFTLIYSLRDVINSNILIKDAYLYGISLYILNTSEETVTIYSPPSLLSENFIGSKLNIASPFSITDLAVFISTISLLYLSIAFRGIFPFTLFKVPETIKELSLLLKSSLISILSADAVMIPKESIITHTVNIQKNFLITFISSFSLIVYYNYVVNL